MQALHHSKYLGFRWQCVYGVGLRRTSVAALQSRLKKPRDADPNPKLCHYPQTSSVQSPLKPFYTWCNMLLTGLHHSHVVSSLLLFIPSNFSILPLDLPSLLPPLTSARFKGQSLSWQFVRGTYLFFLF